MAGPPKSRFSVNHSPKLKMLPKKVRNIGISPSFWLIKEEKWHFCVCYTVSFKTIKAITFLKWRIRIFSSSNNPLPTGLWWLTPSTGKGLPLYPWFFFHHNDRKECRIHHLDGLVHFPFGFLLRTGKTSRGVVLSQHSQVQHILNWSSISFTNIVTLVNCIWNMSENLA